MPRSRGAHHAAGDDQLAVGVVGQDRGDVQVVGDHAQAVVLQQFARDRLGGGADVDDQRTAVRHRRAPLRSRCALGVFVEPLALAVGDVLGGRARHAHAAVEARQQPGVGEQPDVAPHRLQRDAEVLGQRLDADAAAVGAPASSSRTLAGMKVHVDANLRRTEIERSIRESTDEQANFKRTNSTCSRNPRPSILNQPFADRSAASRARARPMPLPRRRARRRRRHQRRRHRARPGRARAVGAAVRARRPGRAHLVVVDQADPRRAALPGVLRVRAGAQGAGRTRGAAEERAAHHVAAALRDAARPRHAPGVDDPRRAVPVRPPGAARGAAGLRAPSTCTSTRPARR